MTISVIICTYNPRRDYFSRVLDALKVQTRPLDQWELLVIDNNSSPALEKEIDLSWHPAGRVICETEQGLTPARLRGIRESRSELLVFVDDDNVLREDFLQQALQISREHPFLGAWGGHIEGEFEIDAPSHLKACTRMLAIQSVERNTWGFGPWGTVHWTAPFGAGLCVRREVALAYTDSLKNSPLRANLGRKGASLTSGEDRDMIFCACDLGLGVGLFKELSLTHLIPKERLTEDYFLKLQEAFGFSGTILAALRDENFQPLPSTAKPAIGERAIALLQRLLVSWRDLRDRRDRQEERKAKEFADQMREAEMRGRERAKSVLR